MLLEQSQPSGGHQPHLRLRSGAPGAVNVLPREFNQRPQRLPGPRRVGGEGRESRGDAHHGGARQIRAAVGSRGEDVCPGARTAAVNDDGEARGGGSATPPRRGDGVDERGYEEGEERGGDAEAAEPAAASRARRRGFGGGVGHGGERPGPGPQAAADAAARRDSSTAREVTTTSSFYFIILLYIFTLLLKLRGRRAFYSAGRHSEGGDEGASTFTSTHYDGVLLKFQ